MGGFIATTGVKVLLFFCVGIWGHGFKFPSPTTNTFKMAKKISAFSEEETNSLLANKIDFFSSFF